MRVDNDSDRYDTLTYIYGMLQLLWSPFIWFLRLMSFAGLTNESEINASPPTAIKANGSKVTHLLSRRSSQLTKHEEDEEEKARVIADSLVVRATEPVEAERSTMINEPHSSRIASGFEPRGQPRRSQRIRLHNGGIQVKSPTSPELSPAIAEIARSLATRPPSAGKFSRKTLILDLDETLIHSISKGGTMSTAHMVEVRFGPHAILYYVHKRPFCDLFLSKVAMWYKLVIFTASVQEYADPVIDWLEQGQPLFRARYYRQHCTFQNGAYMKNLAVAEPNLAKAIIIDNSPLSYRLNQANAIPIEGWISDPSDSELLYLLPVLQSLRTMHDVRSLLSLRQRD